MSYAMLNDVSRCIGCRACQVSCKEWNDRPADATRNRGSYENPPRLSAHTLTRIRFAEHARPGGVAWTFTKLQCMHCRYPGCVSVCTVGALQKTPAGPVVYDARRCIGCRYCEYACPFSIPKYDWGDPLGLIHKCTFCMGRVRAGREPVCAKTCPEGAITFGSRRQLLAEARRRIATKKDRYFDHIYGEHEVGGTQVLYIGPLEPQALGLPEVRDRPVARMSEPVVAATPFTAAALAAALTGLYWYARRRERIEGQEGEEREEGERGGEAPA